MKQSKGMVGFIAKKLCGRVLAHKWDGYTCARCGETRDEQHEWDGCTCRRCGATRNRYHDRDGCVCRRCGDARHRWIKTESKLLGEKSPGIDI